MGLSPDSTKVKERILVPRNERDILIEKYRTLQQEVTTYENNIAFFSASKDSEPLIKLMQEKINKTKAELEELEQKIRQTEERDDSKEKAPQNTAGSENGHEWVDLGLSVKWAACNIGATKPEERGNHYEWGEISQIDNKYIGKFTGNKYKFFKKKFLGYEVIKYNNSIDSKTRLDPIDDAAVVNWGGSWRMPTYEEMSELRDNCKWEWTTQGSM